jgi:signal peptidase
MMRASSQMAGARASDRPRLRPLRATAWFAGHVVVLTCWVLIVVMGVLTWAPHATRFKTDIIVGQSMEPTIPLYSVIVVEPVDPATIRRGDVITFEQPEAPGRKVTHRVVKVQVENGNRTFKTKGDNNATIDPWTVTYSDTGYRVRGHIPHVGWLLIKSQTRWARVMLVVFPVLVLLMQFLKWVWRDENDQDDDEDTIDLFDDPEGRERSAEQLDLEFEDRRGMVA